MAASSPAASGITLELADDAELGEYVTGEDGMALYVFLPDERVQRRVRGQLAAADRRCHRGRRRDRRARDDHP
jgi:hypothetical protein